MRASGISPRRPPRTLRERWRFRVFLLWLLRARFCVTIMRASGISPQGLPRTLRERWRFRVFLIWLIRARFCVMFNCLPSTHLYDIKIRLLICLKFNAVSPKTLPFRPFHFPIVRLGCMLFMFSIANLMVFIASHDCIWKVPVFASISY